MSHDLITSAAARSGNTTLRDGMAIHSNELGMGLGRWIYQLAQYVQAWLYPPPPAKKSINYKEWHENLMSHFGKILRKAIKDNKNIPPETIAEIFHQYVKGFPTAEKLPGPETRLKDLYKQLMHKFSHRPDFLDNIVKNIPEVQKFHSTKKLARYKKNFPTFFASTKTYDEVAEHINAFLDEFSGYVEPHKSSSEKSIFDTLKTQLEQESPAHWLWEMGCYVARIPRFALLHTSTKSRTHSEKVGAHRPTSQEDTATLASVAHGLGGTRISKEAQTEIDKITRSACNNSEPCDKAVVQYIDQIYPDFVKAMFGGAETGARVIASLPVLNVANSVGSTGYIDYINPRHMTHPIMRGVDKYDRPFIAICHTSNNQTENVEVLFQRYTYDHNNWKSGSLDGQTRVFRNHATMFQEDVNYTQRLVNKETVGFRNLDGVEGQSTLQLCGRGQ